MITYRNTAIAAVSVLGAVAIGLNGWPATARMGTATISKSGSTLIIDGGPAANNLTVDATYGEYWTDTSGLTAGNECTQLSPIKVDCPGYTDVALNLGDGDDTAAIGSLIYTHRVNADGGSGNDTIYSGDGDDKILGGDGNDYITGGVGRDTVDGGPGEDTVHGSPGDDVVIGGPGMDSVDGDGGSALDNGNDRLYLVDGEQDIAQCGFGADIVEADQIDVVEALSCESIKVTTQPPAAVSGAKAVVKNAKVKVTWRASSGATSYKVRLSKRGAKKYLGWKKVSATKRTFVIHKKGKYAVQIVAVGPGGSSAKKTVRFSVK